MALRRVYDTQGDIPEGLEDFYVEQDGKWVLDAEPGEGDRNAEDVRRALRARDNEKQERDRIKAQLDELTAKMEGVDPNRLPDALDAIKKLEEMEHQKLLDEKKYEEAAEKKYERQLAELQRTIESIKGESEKAAAKYDAQRKRLEAITIEGALQQEFLKNQVDPAKMRYLLLDAKSKWELDPETDQPVPVDYTQGNTKVTAIGKDGNTLTMEEQVKTILAENPWAVLSSSGSGAQHQSGSSNGAFTMTESEAQDFPRYMAMRQQAEKAGAIVTIVEG